MPKTETNKRDHRKSQLRIEMYILDVLYNYNQ